MIKIKIASLTILISFILTGCAEKINEITEAISGIDAAAERAAKAITLDAHTVRNIELEYKNNTFSVNELFTSILRDVQWEYEQKEEKQLLTIKGNWQEGLFNIYPITMEKKEKLIKSGKVTVQLEIVNNKIKDETTHVTLDLNDERIVDEKGKEALIHLFDEYLIFNSLK
ncbi:hypothetical protein MTP04_23430 [Lysinibacillus sp. PLM2]|nr:hypothetical protein MTP04_23430 [Lysinibacillus sp. PLM2]